MKNVIEELLKTHQVVCKVLEGLEVNNKRFPEIMKTLHRTLLAHAWLQDEVLLPVLKENSKIELPFLAGITREHEDLDRLLKTLIDTSLDFTSGLESRVLQIRLLIETHFRKEAAALYPLVNKVVDQDTLIRLGNEMTHHQAEIREVAWN